MHYKKYVILILLFSISFTQSYFNRVIGNNVFLGDARSMGIGNTYITTGTTSALILSNPARLSILKKNFILDFQVNLNVLNERKSIIAKNFFDDTLGNADIVFNQNNIFNNSVGFIYNNSIGDMLNIGLAYRRMPLISFDYKYEEEIRDEDDDNDIYNIQVDPFIGYYIYKTKGEISLESIGLSFSFGDKKKGNPLAFGIGINKVLPGTMKDDYYIDISNSILDMAELSPIQEINHTSKIFAVEDYFLSYSIDVPFKFKNNFINFIYSFEDEILIRSSNFSYYGLSPYLDLPIYLEYGGYCENVSGDDSPAIDILLASLDEESCNGFNFTQCNNDISYTIQGLHFIKPQ